MEDKRIDRIKLNIECLFGFATGLKSTYLFTLVNDLRKDLEDFIFDIEPIDENDNLKKLMSNINDELKGGEEDEQTR